MKLITIIIKAILAIVPTGLIALSCIYESSDCGEFQQDVIRVNTSALDGTLPHSYDPDYAFTVLFWEHPENLEAASGDVGYWRNPYHASVAPQPVSFYNKNTYDTNYPYPRIETIPVYATGFAPNIIDSVKTFGFKRLEIASDAKDKGRYDFLSCDCWKEIYKGCQQDPFSQEKNKLYFRHLASKLVFYVDRDLNMENTQHVRNVRINNLTMFIDGTDYDGLFTPTQFEWKTLTEADFTDSYLELIEKLNYMNGITGSRPAAGYKAIAVERIAGKPQTDETTGLTKEFILQHNTMDRIPIDGIALDSCYICSPMREDGEPVVANSAIKLKMDISAELSFDPDFPMPDGSSTTDDLTFTRVWKEIETFIYEVDSDGQIPAVNPVPVKVFKPGKEYRIYVNFNRTGVNLVAKEMDWDFGGIHYVTIVGNDRKK